LLRQRIIGILNANKISNKLHQDNGNIYTKN
jgi:hypothetical protein